MQSASLFLFYVKRKNWNDTREIYVIVVI